MGKATKDKRLFYLNITDSTIRMLAKEDDIPKEKITPEVIEILKHVIWANFKYWDNWLKEVIAEIIDEKK